MSEVLREANVIVGERSVGLYRGWDEFEKQLPPEVGIQGRDFDLRSYPRYPRPKA